MKLPCSIESTPLRSAALMPPAPCAWAATLRPRPWAVSMMVRISSSTNCWSMPARMLERTPPVATNLMASAPKEIFCRMSQ